jgi:plastocyanin
MRTSLLAIAVLAGLALAVPGAPAAAPTAVSVKAKTSFRWAPATVTIDRGQAVAFSNPTLTSHDVVFTDGGRFDDGCTAEPACHSATAAPAWGARVRSFASPGTYHFFCTIHGTAAGQGMYGTVIVRAGGGAPATAAPRHLTAHGGRACHAVRRACHATFARITFTLAERARVGALIDRRGARRWHRFARFAINGRRGPNTVVLRRPGRRALGPGSYRITLRAQAPGKTASSAVAARFAIRRG